MGVLAMFVTSSDCDSFREDSFTSLIPKSWNVKKPSHYFYSCFIQGMGVAWTWTGSGRGHLEVVILNLLADLHCSSQVFVWLGPNLFKLVLPFRRSSCTQVTRRYGGSHDGCLCGCFGPEAVWPLRSVTLLRFWPRVLIQRPSRVSETVAFKASAWSLCLSSSSSSLCSSPEEPCETEELISKVAIAPCGSGIRGSSQEEAKRSEEDGSVEKWFGRVGRWKERSKRGKWRMGIERRQMSGTQCQRSHAHSGWLPKNTSSAAFYLSFAVVPGGGDKTEPGQMSVY